MRRLLFIALCAAAPSIAVGCNQDRDCEARKPSIGISFTLEGFGASEIHRLVLDVQIGKESKVFEIDGQQSLAEVFAGSNSEGQITILLGDDKDKAKFAEREQLTIVAIRAYRTDGTLLGESKPPSEPDTRSLTLDGCNFVDRVLVTSGSADGGVVGPLPSIATLATRIGTGDHAPSSIALCNITGSDDLDLVVGTASAPGPDGNGSARGRVDILMGPLAKNGDIEQLEKIATFRIWGAQDEDRLGTALLCTKLDDSKKWDDLVIGAPGADGGRGHAYVHFGSDTTPADVDLRTQKASVTILGPPDGQIIDFGASFAALGGWTTFSEWRSLAIGAPKFGLGGAAIVVGASNEWLAPHNWPAVIDAQGIAEHERNLGKVEDARLGAAISSAKGDRVAVGSAGEVAIWRRDSQGNWSLEDALFGSSGIDFGAAVALSGTTLIVGSPNYGSGAGQVSLYKYDGKSWQPDGTVLAPANTQRFGRSVALYLGHVVIGAEDAAYNMLVGSKSPKKLESTIAAGGDFGRAVAIFDDTLRIAVGAPDANGTDGAVEIFRFNSGADKYTSQVVLDGAQSSNERLGTSVALFDKTLAAGAPGTAAPGRVRVYPADATAPDPGLELLPRDSTAGDEFGASVALRNDHLLVGAPRASGGGAAYVFRQTGDAWEPRARLAMRGATADDQLGTAVSVFEPTGGGDIAYFAGAPGYDDGAVFSNAGAVLRFGSGETRVVTVLADVAGAQLGRHVAAGPVSSPGGDDLLISATKTADGSGGAIFGLAAQDLAGLLEPVTVVRTEFDEQHLTYFGALASGFATSLAVGLIDADGRADVLVGAPRRSPGGTLYLIRGDATLLSPSTSVHKKLDTEETQLVSYMGPQGTHLGEHVFTIPGAGTRSDILVAAPGHGTQRGAVYLLARRESYGSPEKNDVTKHPDVVFAAQGEKENALLGSVAAGGELNGNQLSDLVLVAPGENAIYLVLR